MEISDELWVVLFLGIFNLVGGTALGSSARNLLRGQWSALGLLLWGAGFGGIPLLIAVGITLSSDVPLLCLVNPTLFGGAALFSLLLLPRLSERVGLGALVLSVIGVAFILAGAGIGIALLTNGQTAMAANIGGLFALAGGLLCALGIASR